MLEYNFKHALNLFLIWCLAKSMIINIDKAPLMLISSKQKRKYLKDNSLFEMNKLWESLHYQYRLNLNMNKSFSTCFKKISSCLWLLFQIKAYISLQ